MFNHYIQQYVAQNSNKIMESTLKNNVNNAGRKKGVVGRKNGEL